MSNPLTRASGTPRAVRRTGTRSLARYRAGAGSTGLRLRSPGRSDHHTNEVDSRTRALGVPARRCKQRASAHAPRSGLARPPRTPRSRGAARTRTCARPCRESDVADAVEALARIADGVAVAEQDDETQPFIEAPKSAQHRPRGAGVNARAGTSPHSGGRDIRHRAGSDSLLIAAVDQAVSRGTGEGEPRGSRRRSRAREAGRREAGVRGPTLLGMRGARLGEQRARGAVRSKSRTGQSAVGRHAQRADDSIRSIPRRSARRAKRSRSRCRIFWAVGSAQRDAARPSLRSTSIPAGRNTSGISGIHTLRQGGPDGRVARLGATAREGGRGAPPSSRLPSQGRRRDERIAMFACTGVTQRRPARVREDAAGNSGEAGWSWWCILRAAEAAGATQNFLEQVVALAPQAGGETDAASGLNTSGRAENEKRSASCWRTPLPRDVTGNLHQLANSK